MGPAANERGGALSRREFFKSFRRVKIETQVIESASSGDPAELQRFGLNTLEDLPEAELRQIVPVLRRDVAVSVQDSGVVYRTPDGGEGLVALSADESAALSLFDGIRTLDQIGSALEPEELGQAEPEGGFLVARRAFLRLADRGICHPAGPPRIPARGASEGSA